MAKPYAILSDQHCHDWSAFASTNADGVNSRLQIILDEMDRAADELINLGGETIYFAGDLFHVRGRIDPEVFNPTHKTMKRLCELGIKILAIPGNHDLKGKVATELGNAMQTLSELKGFDVITLPGLVASDVVMVPWQPTCAATLDAISSLGVRREDCDLIIHAPVNGVIAGIPDTGLDPKALSDLGFKRVFAGHYHNHKALATRVRTPDPALACVYSIGATTHQTWSDIGTKAGFLIVHDDRVDFRATHAPRFVEITSETPEDDIPLIVEGNYVRVRFDTITETDVKTLREELNKMGARGVVIQSSKAAAVSRTGAGVKTGESLTASVGNYVANLKHPREAEIMAACTDILSSVVARSAE